MKKLSFWAKHHQWTARLIIISAHILLTAIALLTGKTLQELSIHFNHFFFLTAALLFITGACCYPDKNRKTSVPFYYARQKTCDFILAFSTFLMICFGGNSSPYLPLSSGVLHGASGSINAKPYVTSSFLADAERKSVKPVKPTIANRKALFKKLKTQLRQALRANQSDKQNRGGKIALIILTIILALALLWLVAAISCGLSCNGSEGLAILVLILGVGGVIALSILAFRKINRHFREKNKSGSHKAVSQTA